MGNLNEHCTLGGLGYFWFIRVEADPRRTDVVLVWIIVRAVAGWLAGQVMKGGLRC